MKTIITTTILFLISLGAFAQTEADLNFSSQINPEHEHSHAYYWEYAQGNTSDLQFVLSGLFLFYKEFVSSQDASSCSFTPSCSEYALIAIKKQGFVVGSMNFFDRFSRCNSLSPEHYHRHPQTHLLDDPVE